MFLFSCQEKQGNQANWSIHSLSQDVRLSVCLFVPLDAVFLKDLLSAATVSRNYAVGSPMPPL